MTRKRKTKGKGTTPAPTLEQRETVLERRQATAMRKLELQILESWQDVIDTYVDPQDAYWDDDSGSRWDPVGTSGSKTAVEADVNLNSEASLATIRNECRRLAQTNEFAINGHENRISYIVGSGHSYTAGAKDDDDELSDEDKAAVQTVIDEFIKANKWHQRQQEIVRRYDRDGEVFLRYFPDLDGGMKVRFIEPVQIATPQEHGNDPSASFGIKTDPEDVETVEGYFIDSKLIDALEVQHRKANTDANVKRGVPLYYPVRRNLRRAEKLLRNMTVVADIQSAIAMIRKHPGSNQTGIETLRTNQADKQVTNTRTGTTTYHQHWAPGTILDTVNTEYDFPTTGVNAANFVTILQAELRAIASRLVMPEFMLTSDASNANYSSTMVAEGPAVKMFQRLQWDMIEDDLEVMDQVLDAAVVGGALSAELRDRIEVDVEPPRVETRNRKEWADETVMLVNGKIMSVHTARLRHELDPEFEAEQIEQDDEKKQERADAFFGMAKPGDDKGDDDEGGNKNPFAKGKDDDGANQPSTGRPEATPDG